jgi:uncharacterized membrane protein
MGVTIRHYFNTRHANAGNPTWTWLATAILFVIIIWLSTVPKVLTGEDGNTEVSDAQKPFLAAQNFSKVRDTILGRCSMCHAKEPGWEGVILPPKGVVMETDAEIAAHAREIYLEAGRSHAMPPANVTQISDEERRLLVAWYEDATNSEKTP